MSEGVMLILFFLAVGVIYLIVRYVGNKIVDKGSKKHKTTIFLPS